MLSLDWKSDKEPLPPKPDLWGDDNDDKEEVPVNISRPGSGHLNDKSVDSYVKHKPIVDESAHEKVVRMK